MLVKYYKDRNLAYANRKRFLSFNFTPFAQEEQKAILLGDGANTQIKTKKANICDYVTIDNTRWFVTSYVYCNGGQVILNLQRDVIGEQGLGDCFGKIERGYTDSILKNRKELGLNQVLKERKKVIPSSNYYGNYYVDNHTNEMWGILYIVKPTDGSGSININIPEFRPDIVNYDFIENGTKKIIDVSSNCFISCNFSIKGYEDVYKLRLEFYFDKVDDNWKHKTFCYKTFEKSDFEVTLMRAEGEYGSMEYNIPINDSSFYSLGNAISKELIKRITVDTTNYYKLPAVGVVEDELKDYNGVTIKKDDNYYKYYTSESVKTTYGTTSSKDNIWSMIKKTDYSRFYITDVNGLLVEVYGLFEKINENSLGKLEVSNYIDLKYCTFNYTLISPSEAGDIQIDVSQQLVDEPFIVLVFPLYDVSIYGEKYYNISKSRAFNIFNTFIEKMSGENGYILDAQIYPYCPVITSVSFELLGYPFFTINSTYYTHKCKVNLSPYSDVKKEYIKRKYSIVSPEKTGKFDFNFYDYKTSINDVNGKNIENIVISVKTALKPFGIISSAVIIPDSDSLIGITYESDLRGCQPTGNGFQCSLSSNAFETYKRQNSNYQQIFSLQKDELALSHQTEKVNEMTNATISTITASLMGGMAGAAVADGFWGDFVHSQSIGGAVGAVAAGSSVGIAQGLQIAQNNKLREFEKNLQQQMFDFEIGTIKNLPNSINRISSFNEIILKDFCYIVEIYECTDFEKRIVDDFIAKYGYGIGVFDFISNYQKDGWFLRSTLVSSKFSPNLYNIAANELMGGIYIYE